MYVVCHVHVDVKNCNKLDELFNLMIADVPSDVVSGYCTL